ncbi:MAG: alpha/beta fold hydrolase [Candidatus Obscuribacterales bacterium]|nr:alpha/beta fold hydrolase [Candidatus Obscuribacterales bacterium]
MKEPQKILINGITLNLYVEGEGEPLMFLHGFPDSQKEWRYLIPHFLKAGFKVIAYDQRGFGESDAPEEQKAYEIDKIVADALAVLKYLKIGEKVNLVGHDWGAFIGWQLCLEHPEFFKRYVAISVGHPLAYRHAGFEQKLKGWYILAYQLPAYPEWLLSHKNWAILHKIAGKNPETANWIRDLSRPGRLSSAINWYRANFFYLAGKNFKKCTVPTLGIYSKGDIALTEKQMTDSRKYMFAEWRYECIEDSSHWIPLDQPDALAKTILGWLNGP